MVQFLWFVLDDRFYSTLLLSFLHSSSSQNTLQCNTRLDSSLSNSIIIGGNPTRLIVFCSLSPPLPSISLDIFSPLLFLQLANIRTAGLFNTFFPLFESILLSSDHALAIGTFPFPSLVPHSLNWLDQPCCDSSFHSFDSNRKRANDEVIQLNHTLTRYTPSLSYLFLILSDLKWTAVKRWMVSLSFSSVSISHFLALSTTHWIDKISSLLDLL